MQKQRAVRHLRIIAITEAISYLILLFIAMPLKYWAGLPEVVKYTGWAHGVLFIAFCVALLLAWIAARWSIFFSAVIFIASLIPFAPFFLDHRLKAYETE